MTAMRRATLGGGVNKQFGSKGLKITHLCIQEFPTRLYDGSTPFCQLAILSFQKLGILLTWHFDNMAFEQPMFSSANYFSLSFHFVILHACIFVISPIWHFVNLPFCQLAILSTCHFVNLPFCQLAIVSTDY
jgi:hypothetical protein